LHITALGGEFDPMVNSKKRNLGDKQEVQLLPSEKVEDKTSPVTYSEVYLRGVGHLTLPHSPTLIGRVLKRVFATHAV
jgi:hypothetical protein